MKCDDCLTQLATIGISELTPGTDIWHHCTGCDECSRVATAIATSERDLSSAFAAATSSVDARLTAIGAFALARRRTRMRWVATLLPAATIAIGWLAWTTVVLPAGKRTAEVISPAQRTVTFDLKCLTTQQAGALINPYIRSSGSAYYMSPPGVSYLTVRATDEEIRNAGALLERADPKTATTCQVPASDGAASPQRSPRATP